MIVKIGTLSVDDSKMVLESVSTFVVNRYEITNWYVGKISADNMVSPSTKQSLIDGAMKTTRKNRGKDAIQSIGMPYLSVLQKLKKTQNEITHLT